MPCAHRQYRHCLVPISIYATMGVRSSPEELCQCMGLSWHRASSSLAILVVLLYGLQRCTGLKATYACGCILAS